MITRIYKTTVVHNPDLPATQQPKPGKEKYFADAMHAAFHIETYAITFNFQMTSCNVLKTTDSYYLISKATEGIEDDAKKLAKNQIHDVYIYSGSVWGGGDTGNVDFVSITTNSGHHNRSVLKKVFVDMQGDFFWVGEKVQITRTPGYEPFAGDISKAITGAVSDRKQQITLFAQRKLEILEIEREREALKQKVAALTAEGERMMEEAAAEYAETVVSRGSPMYATKF